MIRRFLLHPGVITMSGLGLVLLVCYNMDQTRRKHEAEQQAKTPKQTAAQTEPVIPVDKTVAQPAVLLAHGTGVDYRSTPTPAPTPEPSQMQKNPDLPSLVLCDIAPTPTPQQVNNAPKADPVDEWLPNGVYIPCVLQAGLQSSHMNTPIEGVVTQDIYQRDYGFGKLILPAGTRLISFAKPGYTRDRVEVDGEWHAVFVNDGTEVSFTGIACDMEYDPVKNEYGLEDKSAGIKGQIVESDHYVRLKALTGVILGSAVNAAQGTAATLLQQGSNNQVVSYQVPEAAPIVNQYIEELLNGHHTAINDTLYVQIMAPKGFYVFTTSPIKPGLRSIGAQLQVDAKRKESENNDVGNLFDPKHVKELLQVAHKEIDQAAKAKDTDEDKGSNAHFGQ